VLTVESRVICAWVFPVLVCPMGAVMVETSDAGFDGDLDESSCVFGWLPWSVQGVGASSVVSEMI
jgi:hypothetical protein